MKKKVLFIILGIVVILTILASIIYIRITNVTIDTNNDIVFEVNTTHKISELISNIDNGDLVNGEELIDTSKIGSNKVKAIIKNKLGQEITQEIELTIVDMEAPVIEGVKDITIYIGDEIDLLSNIVVTDNYDTDIKATIEGNYLLDTSGTYNLKYIASDTSGNTREEEFTLTVKAKSIASISNKKYYIKINKTQNVAMIYTQDKNKEYTNLVKTFVVSTGANTPIGTFTTSDRYETLSLVGGVWGHYTMRIVKAIWFHSVPYFSKPTKDNPHWDDLEYEEYNKLGTSASLGCIRLAVIDAKWIYENIGFGTTVEIYESDELPEGVAKPTPITIDIESPYRGWDPTDPDLDNPWNQ